MEKKPLNITQSPANTLERPVFESHLPGRHVLRDAQQRGQDVVQRRLPSIARQAVRGDPLAHDPQRGAADEHFGALGHIGAASKGHGRAVAAGGHHLRASGVFAAAAEGLGAPCEGVSGWIWGRRG